MDEERVKRLGRPPHQPTEKSRALVAELAALALTQEAIARIVGISEATLKRHYREELKLGFATACKNVRAALLAKATEGNVQAIYLWLRYIERLPELSEVSSRQEVSEQGRVILTPEAIREALKWIKREDLEQELH